MSLVELIESNGAKSKDKLGESWEDIYQVESVYVDPVGAATQSQPTTRSYDLRKLRGEVRVTKPPLKPTGSQPAIV